MSLSITTIETIIGFANSIFNRFSNPPRKREYPDLISDDLVSIGLATGYFFNFLDMTANTMKYNGGLDIYTSTTEGEPDLTKNAIHYSRDNIKIEIILPKRLHKDNFEHCEKEFAQYKKGFFYSKANNRHYGINYSIMEINKGSILKIVDYARPVKAAKPFYEQVLMVATEKNEKWEKTQVAEIAAFKKTLNVLLDRSYGVFANQLNYVEIG